MPEYDWPCWRWCDWKSAATRVASAPRRPVVTALVYTWTMASSIDWAKARKAKSVGWGLLGASVVVVVGALGAVVDELGVVVFACWASAPPVNAGTATPTAPTARPSVPRR